jgi:hypothetical protein
MNGWNLQIEGVSGVVYLTQVNGDGASFADRPIVARFKYASPKANAKSFAKFLEKNFTPAEYFAQIAAGVPPLVILNAKGYVSLNVKRAARFAKEQEAARNAARLAGFKARREGAAI